MVCISDVSIIQNIDSSFFSSYRHPGKGSLANPNMLANIKKRISIENDTQVSKLTNHKQPLSTKPEGGELREVTFSTHLNRQHVLCKM